MHRQRSKVLSNVRVAPGHYVLTLEAPKVARASKPGQFVQLTCGDSCDPLLPRPFSFLDTDSKKISILYHVVGQGTGLLAKIKKNDAIWVLGPLGRGFSLDNRQQTTDSRPLRIMVGGGVGIPPLYHLAKEIIRSKKAKAKDIHIFLGARNKSLLLCESSFKKLGVQLHLATDDGSRGKKGFITESLSGFLSLQSAVCGLQSSLIQTCGPTPMMKAVAAIAKKYKVPCEVSVEVPMACGFGACLGCAIKVNDRYAIACTEGPVFKGEELQW